LHNNVSCITSPVTGTYTCLITGQNALGIVRLFCEEDETAEQDHKRDQHEGQYDEFPRTGTERVTQCEETLKVARHFENADYSERSEEAEYH
jgi:hypothetical protein